MWVILLSLPRFITSVVMIGNIVRSRLSRGVTEQDEGLELWEILTCALNERVSDGDLHAACGTPKVSHSAFLSTLTNPDPATHQSCRVVLPSRLSQVEMLHCAS